MHQSPIHTPTTAAAGPTIAVIPTAISPKISSAASMPFVTASSSPSLLSPFSQHTKQHLRLLQSKMLERQRQQEFHSSGDGHHHQDQHQQLTSTTFAHQQQQQQHYPPRLLPPSLMLPPQQVAHSKQSTKLRSMMFMSRHRRDPQRRKNDSKHENDKPYLLHHHHGRPTTDHAPVAAKDSTTIMTSNTSSSTTTISTHPDPIVSTLATHARSINISPSSLNRKEEIKHSFSAAKSLHAFEQRSHSCCDYSGSSSTGSHSRGHSDNFPNQQHCVNNTRRSHSPPPPTHPLIPAGDCGLFRILYGVSHTHSKYTNSDHYQPPHHYRHHLTTSDDEERKFVALNDKYHRRHRRRERRCPDRAPLYTLALAPVRSSRRREEERTVGDGDACTYDDGIIERSSGSNDNPHYQDNQQPIYQHFTPPSPPPCRCGAVTGAAEAVSSSLSTSAPHMQLPSPLLSASSLMQLPSPSSSPSPSVVTSPTAGAAAAKSTEKRNIFQKLHRPRKKKKGIKLQIIIQGEGGRREDDVEENRQGSHNGDKPSSSSSSSSSLSSPSASPSRSHLQLPLDPVTRRRACLALLESTNCNGMIMTTANLNTIKCRRRARRTPNPTTTTTTTTT